MAEGGWGGWRDDRDRAEAGLRQGTSLVLTQRGELPLVPTFLGKDAAAGYLGESPGLPAQGSRSENHSPSLDPGED